MTSIDLGEPVSAEYSVAGGTARLFRRGATITRSSGSTNVSFDFPMIGRPHISTGTAAAASALEDGAISFQVAGAAEDLIGTVSAALAGRLGLIPSGQSEGAVVLSLLPPVRDGNDVPARFHVPASAVLQERQLYDVALRDDAGVWQVAAPNALYFRSSWHDFGVAHITDIHVARRIDYFRRRLREKGRDDGADRMLNWNDRFRGFIRYANYLHGAGLLDVILATGDLFDYGFEDDDDPNGGGNAEFFRSIILGQSPGPEFPEVERLRVPIFTVSGNHDHRAHPYTLVFNLATAPGGHIFSNFEGYHLLRDDAVALSAGPGSVEMPSLSSDHAKRMIETDPRPYHSVIGNGTSYAVQLGEHRIVMLDSAQDLGAPEGNFDALLTSWVKRADEDKETFVGGSPNCVGVSPHDLNSIVVETLDNMPANGLFILAIHAPLFNVWENVYPYFLRETQRPVHNGQVELFLLFNASPPPDSPPRLPQPHSGWFADGGGGDVTYVKRGTSLDMLDFGVSRGPVDELLRILARIGQTNQKKKADVVLAGHVHRYNEFRLAVDEATGDLAFYMDFYTANPRHYYPTRFYAPISEQTYVEVASEAERGANPVKMPYDALHKYHLYVPPYHNPLATAPNPQEWWDDHRPLVLQSAPLGPLENSQVSFNGFRLLTVRNDVIQRIDFAPIERLEQHAYRLDWAEAIRIDPERRYKHFEKSRAVGGRRAGGPPAAIVSPSTGQTLTIYRGDDAHVRELWRLPSGAVGTGDLSGTAHAPDAAGNPHIYTNPSAGTHIVVYRSADRNIHSLYWTTGQPRSDRLSATAHSPKAAGDPVGFYTPATDTHHVLYVGDDAHLYALYWVGAEKVAFGDSTAGSHDAPPAEGTPSPFVNGQGTNIVAYRGRDKHVRTLWWSNNGLGEGYDDLSGVAGTPNAAGDPVAYYYAQDDSHQVTYRGVDNHLYELFWVGDRVVAGWNLTGAAGAPLAASDPAVLSIPATNTKHVAYRDAKGHLHELSWIRGRSDVTQVNLTVSAIAPLAANQPQAVGFSLDAENRRHVVYVGADDGHVHEISWL